MQQSQQVLLNDGFFQNLYLCLCSRVEAAPGQCLGPAIRFHYTFHYTLSGRGRVEMGKRAYALSAGQGLLIIPNTSVVYQAEEKEPWQYLQIGFSGGQAAGILSSLGIESEPQVFLCDCSQELEAFAGQLLALPKGTFDQLLYRQHLLCAILSVLAKNRRQTLEEESQAGKNPYIDKALSYISCHFAEGALVGNMADYLGITRNYLFLLFKKYLGCSPSAYVIQFRLEQACQLLKQTESTLEEIASSCGYPEPAVFSKAFKRKYGVTPSKYRRIVQGGKEIPF